MRSNALLKWLLNPVVLIVVVIGMRLFSGGSPQSPTTANPQLTPDEMKAPGIEGDTPQDTVATLVAQVRQLRNELQSAVSDNKTQREENQRLRQQENAIEQRIQHALQTERSQLQREQQQAEGLLADFYSAVWTASAIKLLLTCPSVWVCAMTKQTVSTPCAGSSRTMPNQQITAVVF